MSSWASAWCQPSRSPPSTRGRRYRANCTSSATTSTTPAAITERPGGVPRRPRAADPADGGGAEGARVRARRRAAAGTRGCGKPIGRPHLAEAVLSAPANASRLAAEEIDDIGSLIRGYLIEGKPAFPPARDADRRRGGGRRSTMPAAWRSGRTRSGTYPTPLKSLLEHRPLRRPRIDGVEAFYVTPHASRPSCSPPAAASSVFSHRLRRLPRAREPPVLALPRIRDLRPRAQSSGRSLQSASSACSR